MSRIDQLLDATPSLAGLRDPLHRAARSASVVLIVGEPGTGRSSLARAVHEVSERRGALVEFDPGVIPSTLFESELFGYRAGAFTGARGASEGRLGRAEGGSLLLDPVEELPLDAQPKLLRLLAESRYAPLGGRERTADVRVIAVASHELPQRVSQGLFREDLYYRLEVLAFRLPALRERREDLEPLIEALLSELAIRHGLGQLRLADEARSWMLDYSWPGNVRQLRNVLERRVVLDPGQVVNPEMPRDHRGSKPPSLIELEREGILRALEYTRGHQGKAAEILGISRKALWEKRKRLDLP